MERSGGDIHAPNRKRTRLSGFGSSGLEKGRERNQRMLSFPDDWVIEAPYTARKKKLPRVFT